jgi:hypothetical protein
VAAVGNFNFFSAAKVIFDGDKDRWNYFVNPRLATKWAIKICLCWFVLDISFALPPTGVHLIPGRL